MRPGWTRRAKGGKRSALDEHSKLQLNATAGEEVVGRMERGVDRRSVAAILFDAARRIWPAPPAADSARMTVAIDVRAAMARTLRRDLTARVWKMTISRARCCPRVRRAGISPVSSCRCRLPPTAQHPRCGRGELNSGDGADGLDDADEPDQPPARPSFLPSSIGLSFLVPEGVTEVRVVVCWGDYRAAYAETEEDTPLLVDPASEGAEDEAAETEPATKAVEGPPSDTTVAATPSKRVRRTVWHRTPKQTPIDVTLPEGGRDELPVPDSDGLALAVVARRTTLSLPDGQVAARSVSLFLVNRRAPRRGRRADEALVFQAALHVECNPSFIARPNPRGYGGDDFDESLADLHYRDVAELAVGHNVSADWTTTDGACRPSARPGCRPPSFRVSSPPRPAMWAARWKWTRWAHWRMEPPHARRWTACRQRIVRGSRCGAEHLVG